MTPFEGGAREMAGWYLAGASRQVADDGLDTLMDKAGRLLDRVVAVAGQLLK